MDKRIKRIRLNQMYSENNLFDKIVFKDGVNLIVGEKTDNNTVKGRKTNGVGKSISISFIDFCLLGDYSKSRLKKIPKEAFPLEEYIILDLNVGTEKLLIKRNRVNENRPIFIRDNKEIFFDNIGDAKNYFNDLMYIKGDNKFTPSMRSLFSIFLRDERSGFMDILQPFDVKLRIPIKYEPHLYLLNVKLENYKKSMETIKELDELKPILSKQKKQLTKDGKKKIEDVSAELNAAEDELRLISEALDGLKTNESFEVIERDILVLENQLEKLRKKNQVLKYQYKKINELPVVEEIDENEIKLVYDQFKDNLGDVVVKSLSEVIGFKNKIEEFQKTLRNEESIELEKKISQTSKKINKLDLEYSKKLKLLDSEGVLKNLKTSLKVYESKNSKTSELRRLLSDYEENEKKKKNLKVRKSTEILLLSNDIDNNERNLNSFEKTILNIHESIMGNKECSFLIETVDLATRKTPIDIKMRIFDDGSHSVNRTKVFIYDMSLLFNEYTSENHPKFLVHDNIFDVDQDTLIRSLNYLSERDDSSDDFQYILTLNRDKIENEENNINLDIEKNKIVNLTKKSKFLKQDYQEK